MVTFDEIIIKQTVDKLLKGEDYRSIVVSKINADFEKYKSLTTAKENGRLRLEGKDYVVQDGDIMYFRFNV